MSPESPMTTRTTGGPLPRIVPSQIDKGLEINFHLQYHQTVSLAGRQLDYIPGESLQQQRSPVSFLLPKRKRGHYKLKGKNFGLKESEKKREV
jgi:hypothetical protein